MGMRSLAAAGALLVVVAVGLVPASGQGPAPPRAYYLFLAGAPEGCQDCYVPLLIVRQTLEDVAASGSPTAVVLVTTYERDSIWSVERGVSLTAADVSKSERMVRLRGRRYRYHEIPAAEVVRLLENPAGTIPIHRTAPIPDRRSHHDLIATFAGARAQVDTTTWKSYRNDAMGFEVKHPPTWRVSTVQGPETVILGEPREPGKPQRAIQFWVQRQANPRGLSIEEWVADQLRRLKAPSTPVTTTSLGGRRAIRMDSAGSLGRSFHFHATLNRADIFTITIGQEADQAELDETYHRILSTLRFLAS